jgi:hypothetical protein
MDPFFQRRKRYEAVLRPMGLWERFAAIPRPLQELFWKMKLPDPAVVFDDDAVAAAPAGLRAAAERYLRAARLEVDGGMTLRAHADQPAGGGRASGRGAKRAGRAVAPGSARAGARHARRVRRAA